VDTDAKGTLSVTYVDTDAEEMLAVTYVDVGVHADRLEVSGCKKKVRVRGEVVAGRPAYWPFVTYRTRCGRGCGRA